MPHSHRHHHNLAREFIEKMEENSDKTLGDRRRSHENEENANADGGDEAVIIHTVYKTLQPTFDGPIAGYSTLDQAPVPEATPALQSPQTQAAKSTTTITTYPSPNSEVKPVALIPTAIRQPLTSSGLDNILVEATGRPTFSPSIDVLNQGFISAPAPGPTPTAPSTSPSTSQSTRPAGSSNETGAGTKAGIAFGVLGGVLVAGLIAFLLYTRRRRQTLDARAGEDDEKCQRNGRPFETMTIRSDPNAPRVSLRPVTQFFPNWTLDKRASKGVGAAPLMTPAAVPIASNGQNDDMRDRPSTSQSTHPGNPFGSQAERVMEPTIPEHGTLPWSDPFTANGPAVAAGAAGSAAAGVLARKASMRSSGRRPVDLAVDSVLTPVPGSPADTESSMAPLNPGSAAWQSKGAAAIAAAGGSHISNIHRVQLDFKPSLEDEMEMKAGELVRLLHEYDDGWALCIRLDRSQQGVVPRTCLSTRPVKPRSPEGGARPGPPVNPHGQFQKGLPPRPETPQGQIQMGLGGTGPRPMSLSGCAQTLGPRHDELPLTQITQPLDRSSSAPPTTPAGSPPRGPPAAPPPEPIGRKPIPGQAY
ncbi:hypothetical protein E4U53_002477 [Claviceps sorghi]|nr:hypothetical protein E4U53_002477 [Claviceps sorghi]